MNAPRPYRQTRILAHTAGQIDKAGELRVGQTEAEQAAWHLLRSLRLKGFTFRRQHPVGHYIADFCCPQHRFIVELDGSVHERPSQAKRDGCRDTYPKNRRYYLLRLSNGIVLEGPEVFVVKVLRQVGSLPEVLD